MKKLVQTAAISAMLLALLATNVSARGDLIIQFDPSSEDALSSAIAKIADEAYQVNLQGLDALEQNDLDAALAFFDQAVKLFPQYSDALNNRGVVLYRRGDVGGARRVWEDVIRLDPQYHVSYYNIGLIHLHSNRPDDAIHQFELALGQNMGFTEAMVRIGAIHLQEGRIPAAMRQFERAYRIAPANQDVWNFYSYGLLRAGDTARAVTVLRSVGNNAHALAQLGRIEGVRRRYAQAAEFLVRAVALGAAPAAMLDLANVQVDGDNCTGALETLTKYLTVETRPNVDTWLLAGFAANNCGSTEDALAYYERGLRQYPRDPLLLYNAGQIHFTLGDHAKAEEMWSGAGDAHQTPHIMYLRAMAARTRNDLASAEQLIKQALAMDEKAQYHDFLGVVYQTRGNTRAAEEHFRKALAIDPNLASAQLNLAIGSKSAAEMEKAVDEAAKRLASCRGNRCAEAALQLSILYYHQRNIEQALATLESVRPANRDVRVFRHIAIYNRELGRHDRAIAALEAAAAKFRRDTRVQYELAEAYLAAGSPQRAARIFETLLPNWRENVWRLHYQLGYAYMEMNDLTRAKQSFERSMAARPDNPAARALLAFVLNRMGETDKAVAHWEQTVVQESNNATIHINLGLSYESRGEYERALTSYRAAQSLNPADKAIHINIGNAFKGMGRVPEAFEAYTAGLGSNKRDMAAFNIFLLAGQQNDSDRAERMYALLQREFPSSVYFSRVSGEMYLMRGDTAKAVSTYQAISDKDAHDWFTLSRIYASRGERQRAEGALANIPDDTHWRRQKNIVRATLAFNSGDYRGAYQAYREIVNTAGASRTGTGILPADVNTHVHNMILAAHRGGMHGEAIEIAKQFENRVQGQNRAEILRIAGNSAIAARDWAEAKNLYSRLAALEPNNAVTQYNLAVTHYNLGEVEEAHNRYQTARRIDATIRNMDIETHYEQSKRGGAAVAATGPDDSLIVWYNRAVELQNTQRDTLAEALYRKILDQDSTYSLAWNNLGAIYGARGELELAETAYLRAISIQPSPEAYANLANIYIAIEEYAKARDIVARGLAGNPGNRLLSGLEREIRAKLR
ncbi:MAG: tetratricopeptide repeat protein [Chitinispirillales bacterium]|jgi:tetratricopeptide (TPR) repeat protein|nr:tetratricopeptide repeat protein [Chitinispirillales bacterium]